MGVLFSIYYWEEEKKRKKIQGILYTEYINMYIQLVEYGTNQPVWYTKQMSYLTDIQNCHSNKLNLPGSLGGGFLGFFYLKDLWRPLTDK